MWAQHVAPTARTYCITGWCCHAAAYASKIGRALNVYWSTITWLSVCSVLAECHEIRLHATSFPWLWQGVVDTDSESTLAVLERAKKEWNMVQALSRSDRYDRVLRNQLQHVTYPCYRKPMLAWESAGWTPNDWSRWDGLWRWAFICVAFSLSVMAVCLLSDDLLLPLPLLPNLTCLIWSVAFAWCIILLVMSFALG